MWKEFIGRRSEPVRNAVERGAVRKFAEAIGDGNPLYLDEEAASRSRHGRMIAPPTFPFTLDYGRIPGLPLPESGLIHGEQSFTYERPLFVGEEILCYTTLEDAYEKKGGTLHFLVFDRIGEDLEGERIYTATSVFIITEAVRKEMER